MRLQDDAKLFVEAVKASDYTVVLTGAGVSTASGIPDFRSPNGLYSKISQETFELEFLMSRPEEYYRIAIEHIHPLADREPNVTHRMLAELEKRGFVDILITQNIDGLHQKAGSENVVEFHGNVTGFYCTRCRESYERVWVVGGCRGGGGAYCGWGGMVRPGIVFFGDMIPLEALTAAQLSAEQSGVFAVLGSSLQVQPAAGMAALARRCGAKLIIVNRDPTGLDVLADCVCVADLSAFSEAVLGLL